MSGIYSIPPNNAAPRAYFTGTQDKSQRAVPTAPEVRPIHLPIYHIIAPDGPLEPQMTTLSDAVEMYGKEIVDTRSPFATPYIPFLRQAGADANMMFIQRLVPATIKDVKQATARIRLSLDLKEVQDMRPYKRDPMTGHVSTTTVAGHSASTIGKKKTELQEDTSVPTISGYVGQWVYELVDEFGSDTTPRQKGDYVRYPILELEALYFGSRGNNIAISIDAPFSTDRIPVNSVLARNQFAYPYRFTLSRRDNKFATPTPIRTALGDTYVDMSFKRGAIDVIGGNTDIYVGNALLPLYEDMGGTVEKYAPFGDIRVHHSNLETVLEKLYNSEVKLNKYLQEIVTDPVTGKPRAAEEAMHLINIISARDLDGRHYYTFRINNEITKFDTSTNSNNVVLNEYSPIFAMGGRDGVTPAEIKESQLQIEVNGSQVVPTPLELYDYTCLKHFQSLGTGNEEFPLESMARYPFKNIYDPGFSMNTKLAMFRFLHIRSDSNITVCPYDFVSREVAGSDQESLSVVAPRMQKLNEVALSYAESTIHQTSCCRVVIVAPAGEAITGDYTKRIPYTLEIQHMRSLYMGSGEGKFTPGRAYDTEPNNEGKLLKNPNITYLRNSQRESLWANGAVWFEYKTRKVLFCPGLQTVYPDDTSVLNSDINMQAVCELNYRCFRLWTRLSGNSQLSDDQLVEVADKMLTDDCRGVFDDRYVIRPETLIVGRDKLAGWIWETRVHAEMPNMKTVMRGTVITHRIGGN